MARSPSPVQGAGGRPAPRRRTPRALAGLGRYDHALEVLGADSSPEARDVRAEVLWKTEKWAEAAALYEARLGERYKDPAALTPDEEARLIRAGVGYSLARDTAALTRLSRNYRPFVAGARAKPARPARFRRWPTRFSMPCGR